MTADQKQPKSIEEAVEVDPETKGPTTEEPLTEAALERMVKNQLSDWEPDPDPTQDEIYEPAADQLEPKETGPITTGPPPIAPIGNDVRARLEEQFQAEREAEEETSQLNPKIASHLKEVSARIKETALEKEATIPVSNIDRQPANEDSSPESPESPPQVTSDRAVQDFDDTGLQKLSEFINSSEFSVDWCRMHLLEISRIPNVIPSPTIWDLPPQVDIAKLVFDIVRTVGFVENTWPSLRIVLGSSCDNVLWACGVLCTIAIFDGIKLLPLTEAAMKFGETYEEKGG